MVPQQGKQQEIGNSCPERLSESFWAKLGAMRILPFLLLFSLVACMPPESVPTTSNFAINSGDIIVSSTTTRAVYHFDKNGNFKDFIWRSDLTTDTVGGLGWMHTTNEVLVAVDGAPDRVDAISLRDGRVRTLYSNAQLTGTIRNVTQLLDSRSLIVSETNSLERFNELGLREAYGTAPVVWPSAVMGTTLQDVKATSDGGWIGASSTNTVGVRKFPDSITTFAASATALPPTGTTAAHGVAELANGQILVSWEGTATDYLSIYNADLTFDRHVFGNSQAVLVAPRGVAQAANGNYLVVDTTNDYILEIDDDGIVKNIIGRGLLDTPVSLLVVP